MGAGESQVVAPDGTVLAIASREAEEFVHADIDLAQADGKRRPDGSDLFALRGRASMRPSRATPPNNPSVRRGTRLFRAPSCNCRTLGRTWSTLRWSA